MADPDSHYGFPEDGAGEDEQSIISVRLESWLYGLRTELTMM